MKTNTYYNTKRTNQIKICKSIYEKVQKDLKLIKNIYRLYGNVIDNDLENIIYNIDKKLYYLIFRNYCNIYKLIDEIKKLYIELFTFIGYVKLRNDVKRNKKLKESIKYIDDYFFNEMMSICLIYNI